MSDFLDSLADLQENYPKEVTDGEDIFSAKKLAQIQIPKEMYYYYTLITKKPSLLSSQLLSRLTTHFRRIFSDTTFLIFSRIFSITCIRTFDE